MKKFILSILVGLVAGTLLAANFNSDTLLSVNQSNSGRVLVKYFTYATGTSTNAVGDVIFLAFIPMNARIIDGAIAVSAMGGAQTIDIGLKGADNSGYIQGTTADDPDLFTASPLNCSNVLADTFANLVAGDQNADYELGQNHVYLTASAVGATWPTNETLTGWVKYIEP